MIRFTYKQLVTAVETGALARFCTDKDLLHKIKRRAADIWEQCLDHYDKYQKTQRDLCKEYGQRIAPTADDAPNSGIRYIFPDAEKEETYDKEIDDLKTVVVEVLGDAFFDAELVKKITSPGSTLSPVDLSALKWLILPDPEAEGDAREEATAAPAAPAEENQDDAQ